MPRFPPPVPLSAEDILSVQLVNRQSVIHVFGGRIHETYTTGKKIELISGETLSFPRCRKRELKAQLRTGRRQIVQSLSDSDAPATREEYQRHYASYDSAPFAFTDIEMLFNEERAAADWIFRYSNEVLAKAEKRRWNSSSTTLSAVFSQYGRQITARLRAHSAVRRDAGN